MKKTISFFLCLLIVVSFSACRAGLYMDDFIDTRWTCDEMNLQFTYNADNLDVAIGTLVKDGKTIDIACMYTMAKTILIHDKSEYYATADGEVCVPLLIGRYRIKGDTATYTITEDNLFGGDYLDKVIYLRMTPLT